MYLSDLYGFDALARELLGNLNPTVRTRKSEEGVGFEFDFPGVTAEDIDISTDNGVLAVTAKNDDRKYAHTMSLPHTVDVSGAQADYENGVLRIAFPWSEAAKPKKIQVKGAQRERELAT